ncbi:hypothetical protein N7454_005623 [Penicillium verhagenii]|nr:hypothetical protein N7454_005623 [Penicillium verhagenii]
MAAPTDPSKRKPTPLQLGKIEDFFIPKSKDEWENLVSMKAGLRTATINSMPSGWIGSGSGASDAQYAMLRSYVSEQFELPDDIFGQGDLIGIPAGVFQTADNILAGSEEWSRYLAVVSSVGVVSRMTERDTEWPGSFAIARQLQEQVVMVSGVKDVDRLAAHAAQSIQTRSRLYISELQLPEAEDEATVNAAGIVFLQALSHLAGVTHLEWVLNRVQLSCPIPNKFDSYTDGALRSIQDGNIFAVFEAKKRRRDDWCDRIAIQETCQLAGWHLRDSAEKEACFNDHLLLVSQDRDEFFVTFAKYNESYNRYMMGSATEKPFLVLHRSGPYNIGKADEMVMFGRIIIAATIVAGEVR